MSARWSVRKEVIAHPWLKLIGARTTATISFVFCAASFVIYSHHFALAGYAEPLVPGYEEDFGKLGVEVFFCLSGFLICRSLMRDRTLARFVAARILRIFPNLFCALAATSVATLIWYHNWAHAWSHIEYVVRNILMFFDGVDYVIPGVFADAKVVAVNGPLWSLPSELWLYCLLFAIFLLPYRRTSVALAVCAGYFALAWALTPIVGQGHFLHSIVDHPFSATFICRSKLLATFSTESLRVLPTRLILYRRRGDRNILAAGESQRAHICPRGGLGSFICSADTVMRGSW